MNSKPHAHIKKLSSVARAARVKELPPALQRVVQERVARVALVYSFGYLLAMTAGEFVSHKIRSDPFDWNFAHLAAAGSILFGVLCYIVVKSGRIPEARQVDVGLAFMVITSLGIGFGSLDPAQYWRAVAAGETLVPMGVSWIAVWILVYPVVVPSPPRKTLLAASLSAATGLISVSLLASLRGVDVPPAEFMAGLTIPNFICVILSFMSSSILYRLGQDLGEAQEAGSYRLERRLGEGGMGEVWLARHRMLARPAAVKVIRTDAGDSFGPAMLKRFELEAQATAALASPHTVRLYDFGTADDGSFYYAMELLDGLDLDSLVTRFGPLPPERVVHLLSGACESLAEAHARGLVHRDIKPGNIFSCRLGLATDFVKVLDFGLVRPDGAGEADTRITMVGEALGTPAYLAPESASGGVVDGRADLYGLGCVAFWLLTGRQLFTGDNALQVAMKHVQEEPSAPSALSDYEIPPELDAIVLRCLSKSPDHRPATAQGLLEHLQQVPLSEPWTRQRSDRWWHLHLPEHIDSEIELSRRRPS